MGTAAPTLHARPPSTDVGHYFDVKTLTYVDNRGPGRIHVQDLVLAIDAGATLWMAAGGRDSVENYPEVQAVAYAQWFTYAFALWEEQFRGWIASYFDQCADEKIRRSERVDSTTLVTFA